MFCCASAAPAHHTSSARKNRNTRSAPTRWFRRPAARPRLLEPALEAAGLVALELQVVVDEHVAELPAEQRLAFERIERRRQAPRQQRPLGGVGLVVARAGIESCCRRRRGRRRSATRCRDRDWPPARRCGSRSGSRRSPGAAQHAHHRAAMVVAPAGAVGRERVRPEAAVAVDGRRREHRRRHRMLAAGRRG